MQGRVGWGGVEITGRAGQGRAGQGRAGQGKDDGAGQGKDDRAGQGITGSPAAWLLPA